LGSEGVLDSPLPQPLTTTVYARLGDVPAALLIGIACVFVLRWRVRMPLISA